MAEHEERLPGDNHYIQVGVGGVWVRIPGQSDCSVDISQAVDNVTTKADKGWEHNISGNTSVTVTVNGVYYWPDRDIFDVFEYALDNHENFSLMEVWGENDGDVIQIRRGAALVTGFSRNSTTGGHVAYTVTFTISGPWTADDIVL